MINKYDYKKLNEQGSLQQDMQGIGNEGAMADMAMMMPQQLPNQFQDTQATSLQPETGAFNGY